MAEQKSSRRPAFPFVLTGNGLRDGRVVWFDGSGWSSELGAALVARDEATALRLDAALADSFALVVDPYAVAVGSGRSGEPLPGHYRERIRLSGPTFAREGPL